MTYELCAEVKTIYRSVISMLFCSIILPQFLQSIHTSVFNLLLCHSYVVIKLAALNILSTLCSYTVIDNGTQHDAATYNWIMDLHCL